MRSNRLKSIGYTLRNVYARWTGAYRKNVAAFACITDFQRQKLIAAGYEAERVTVIPNGIDAPTSYDLTGGNYVAYIGRLSYEKGYDLLIEVARRNPSIPFRFAGAKREQSDMEIPGNVEFMGYLQKEELSDFICHSRFVVCPVAVTRVSLWLFSKLLATANLLLGRLMVVLPSYRPGRAAIGDLFDLIIFVIWSKKWYRCEPSRRDCQIG